MSDEDDKDKAARAARGDALGRAAFEARYQLLQQLRQPHNFSASTWMQLSGEFRAAWRMLGFAVEKKVAELGGAELAPKKAAAPVPSVAASPSPSIPEPLRLDAAEWEKLAALEQRFVLADLQILRLCDRVAELERRAGIVAAPAPEPPAAP